MPLIRTDSGFSHRIALRPSLLNATVTYALWDGSAMKVGHTNGHPMVRLKSLQTGNPLPLELLAYTATMTEREAHNALSLRLTGEWFFPTLAALDLFARWDWLNVPLWHKLQSELRW